MAGWLSGLGMLLTVSMAQAGNSPADSSASVATNQAAPSARNGGGDWLFAYFRQRYESRVEIDTNGITQTVPLPNPMRVEQLHFALSSDGRHWTPLNDNGPVWHHWLRDPYLHPGPDGLWHLVATGGSSAKRPGESRPRPVCLYAESRDLVNWTNVHSLLLMTGVLDETGRPARNIWAPEWFFDQKNGSYFVFWSSSFEDQGWKHSRLWFARTRDWQTFTPAKVLFQPPYSAIDGTLWEQDGKYSLFHKEEEFGASKGERRAIRLATADQLEGPYTIYEGPLNGGQIAPVISEGPEIMPDPKSAGWLLIYDYCMSNGYGVSTSSDLIHWSVETSVAFPPDARHGCFAQLTETEAGRLRATYGQK